MASERKTTRQKIQPVGPLSWRESGSSHYISYLRFQFLNAALTLRPEMKAGLLELLRLSMAAPTPPNEKAYGVALVTWATRYNLIADKWCRSWLRRTLVSSRLLALSNPGAELEIDFGYEFHGPPSVEPPPLPNLTWNPSELPRDVMERRYRKYLDQVEDTYGRAGYRPIPERREATHTHIWWLAGYQVCGWSQNRIYEAVDRDYKERTTILYAIHNLAREIELTLRDPAANDRSWTAKKIRAALYL